MMLTFSRVILCQILLACSFLINAQSTGEWLVEMDPITGSFQPVGPMLEDVFTIYIGLQCKDETNGQYIFMQPPSTLIGVDISNAEIVHETFIQLPNAQIWGFHCLNDCDTLLLLGRHNMAEYTFMAHFDRFNGTGIIGIGDSIPNDDPTEWSLPFLCEAFDPLNNQLFMYSDYGDIFRVLDGLTGELLNTYQVSASPVAMAYDDINNELYAIEQNSTYAFQLLQFNAVSGDFVQIGEPFTTMGVGYIQTSIDGNNQRMFITRSGSSQGSFMTAVDLVTGQLITDVQTMPAYEGGGLFGGPNTINGRYFNSTDQLITLHWGDGIHLSTPTFGNGPESHARIYPNPNRGIFRLDLNTDDQDIFDVQILDLNGQLVYEMQNVRNAEPIPTDLSSGAYIAKVLGADGAVFTRIQFVVASGK